MATFKFKCRYCNQKIEADIAWIGMTAECPDCRRKIEIRKTDEPELKSLSSTITPNEGKPFSGLGAPTPFPQPFSVKPPEWNKGDGK